MILFEQKDYPTLQNRLFDNEEDALGCLKGDICIVEDEGTGLIYNAAFKQELMVYDASYNNEQGLSPSFQRHLNQVVALVEGSLGKERIVEVGCGKGFFLEMLLARGIDVTGFDPTYDGDNPRVIREYFEPSIISTPAQGLIIRHVLEHIPNPYNFLRQLRKANGGSGLIYIEVPCFDWICRKRAWFDIFYEHVNYFRISDFERMFGIVIKSGRFFGEQYLYIVADLASLREPVNDVSNAVDFPADFLSSLTSSAHERVEMPVCVWGGASKGVIFSLLRQRAHLPVNSVIDVNPAKQGKFLPASGLKVESPESVLPKLTSGAPIYVMNSNYLEEIKSMSQHRFEYRLVDQ